jgi:hypothetical protein
VTDLTDDATYAYVGYRAGTAVLVIVDDGSRDMHRKLADHLKGKDSAVSRLPIEVARGEIAKTLAARKAAR